MKKNNFGIVILVKDLDLCRGFYRDVVGLGEPAADSSFAAFFELSGNLTLTLEKSAAPYLEHASSATSWCLPVADIEGFKQRFSAAGYPAPEEAVRIGRTGCLRCLDPEGNCFFIHAAATSGDNYEE